MADLAYLFAVILVLNVSFPYTALPLMFVKISAYKSSQLKSVFKSSLFKFFFPPKDVYW